MAPLHFLGKDDKNAHGIVNSTIKFLMSRRSTGGAKWLFGHVVPFYQYQCHFMPMALLYSFGQDDRNGVQYVFPSHTIPLALVLASHDAVSICNVTIASLRSRQSKLNVMWLIWSYDTISTGTGIKTMPLVLVSHDANNIIDGIIAFLG